MPEHSVTFQASVLTGRRLDGVMQAVRVHAPKLIDLWYWVNRDTDTLEELRPYRVGSRRKGHGHADQ